MTVWPNLTLQSWSLRATPGDARLAGLTLNVVAPFVARIVRRNYRAELSRLQRILEDDNEERA